MSSTGIVTSDLILKAHLPRRYYYLPVKNEEHDTGEAELLAEVHITWKCQKWDLNLFLILSRA